VRGRSLRPVIERHRSGADVPAWDGGHPVHEDQPAQATAWLQQQMAALPRTRAHS